MQHLQVGKYEVTAGQYTEFLNAVAKTDTYEAVQHGSQSSMSRPYGCDIQRTALPATTPTAWLADWANRR